MAQTIQTKGTVAATARPLASASTATEAKASIDRLVALNANLLAAA